MRSAVPFLLLALSAGLAAAGCASVDRTIDKGTEAAADLLLPPDAETKLGNQLAGEIRQDEKISTDREVQAYVAKVGQRIVAQVPKKDRQQKFTFQVIDKPNEVNAFAIPGGHIYVYSGLIQAADSEAELAAVLAHEVGHQVGRHGAETLVKAMGLQTVMGLALGENPNQLAALGSSIAAQGYLAQHSQEQERESDTLGLRYLIDAGYDPQAMPRFFEKLQKMSGRSPDAISAFFASHPQPGARAKTAREAIARKNGKGGRTEIVGGFERIQARIGTPGKPTSPSGAGQASPAPKAPAPPAGAKAKSGGGTKTDSGTAAPPPVRR